MQFIQAFKFQFGNIDWFKKLIIPGLIMLIPIVGQLYVLGWVMEIARRHIQGQDDSQLLPLTRFGEYLKLGFQAFVVALVYAIPTIILALPILIASLAFDPSGNAGPGIIIAVSVCFGLILVLYEILYAFILPAALGNFLAHGTIRDGLNIKAAFALVKKAPVVYLLVILGSALAGLIAPIGGIACGIGTVLTAIYGQSAYGHLLGQAYVKASSRL